MTQTEETGKRMHTDDSQGRTFLILVPSPLSLGVYLLRDF